MTDKPKLPYRSGLDKRALRKAVDEVTDKQRIKPQRDATLAEIMTGRVSLVPGNQPVPREETHDECQRTTSEHPEE